LKEIHTIQPARNSQVLSVFLWWVDPGWTPGAHQRGSVTPLLSWTEEKKYNKRLTDQDKERERSLINNHHVQNRLNLGKLIYYHSEYGNEKIKTHLKTPSPHPSLLPRLNFTPDLSTSSY